MCLFRKQKQPSRSKAVQKAKPKRTRRKANEDYLIEDPSIRHEAHSRWEAEDIYDEDDFCDR